MQIRVEFPREGKDALFRFNRQETVGTIADFVADFFGLKVAGTDWRLMDAEDRIHHRDTRLRRLPGRRFQLFETGHVV